MIPITSTELTRRKSRHKEAVKKIFIPLERIDIDNIPLYAAKEEIIRCNAEIARLNKIITIRHEAAAPHKPCSHCGETDPPSG